MPTKVNVELIVVWACVGFFTGAGWALATWLVGRILGLTHLKNRLLARLRAIDRRGPHPVWPMAPMSIDPAARQTPPRPVPAVARRPSAGANLVVGRRHSSRHALSWHSVMIQAAAGSPHCPAVQPVRHQSAPQVSVLRRAPVRAQRLSSSR